MDATTTDLTEDLSTSSFQVSPSSNPRAVDLDPHLELGIKICKGAAGIGSDHLSRTWRYFLVGCWIFIGSYDIHELARDAYDCYNSEASIENITSIVRDVGFTLKSAFGSAALMTAPAGYERLSQYSDGDVLQKHRLCYVICLLLASVLLISSQIGFSVLHFFSGTGWIAVLAEVFLLFTTPGVTCTAIPIFAALRCALDELNDFLQTLDSTQELDWASTVTRHYGRVETKIVAISKDFSLAVVGTLGYFGLCAVLQGLYVWNWNKLKLGEIVVCSYGGAIYTAVFLWGMYLLARINMRYVVILDKVSSHLQHSTQASEVQALITCYHYMKERPIQWILFLGQSRFLAFDLAACSRVALLLLFSAVTGFSVRTLVGNYI